MKRLLFAPVLCLVLLNVSFSCKQQDNPSANCPNAGAFVKQVKNVNGQVYFDSTQSSYFIRVPNSIDSYDFGYACNLPTDYQKSGFKVKFNGSYYQYDKTVDGWLDNKYYYLSIESVSAAN